MNMKQNTPYDAPQSDLSNNERDKKIKTTFTKKFLYGFSFSVIFFLLVVMLFLESDAWGHGAIGAFVVSLASGLISGVFPSQDKFIYIPAGFIFMLIVTMII